MLTESALEMLEASTASDVLSSLTHLMRLDDFEIKCPNEYEYDLEVHEAATALVEGERPWKLLVLRMAADTLDPDLFDTLLIDPITANRNEAYIIPSDPAAQETWLLKYANMRQEVWEQIPAPIQKLPGVEATLGIAATSTVDLLMVILRIQEIVDEIAVGLYEFRRAEQADRRPFMAVQKVEISG